MNTILHNTIHVMLALALPPLLLGVIGKTKAFFGGRVGPPLLQPYYDLIKLFQKGSVFSPTVWWPQHSPDGKSANWTTSDALADYAGGATFHGNLVEVSLAMAPHLEQDRTGTREAEKAPHPIAAAALPR